jgi:hypothetical protein
MDCSLSSGAYLRYSQELHMWRDALWSGLSRWSSVRFQEDLSRTLGGLLPPYCLLVSTASMQRGTHRGEGRCCGEGAGLNKAIGVRRRKPGGSGRRGVRLKWTKRALGARAGPEVVVRSRCMVPLLPQRRFPCPCFSLALRRVSRGW